mgnify:CR=1 FL=1
MKTKVIKIKDKTRPEDGELLEAAEILRSGGLVAFPTETVYGLGANALDEAAAKKIYAAKGRPSDNPLIAHISSMEELPALVREIPEAGRKLAEKYWPGPLTMIFPKKDVVPYGTTGGLDTVAIIAAGTRADMSFIMAMQTLRLFTILLTGPAIARFISRYAARQ